MAQYGCNITQTDSYIRLIISFIIMVLAVWIQEYILMFISMILVYTALTKYCLVYRLFNINKTMSLTNYYTSHLPAYNPSAVFIFDKMGNSTFQNKSAQNNFLHIDNFNNFNILDLKTIINKEIKDTYYYNYKDFHYQLEIQGVLDIKSVLVYATDITELINLNEEIDTTQKEIIYTMGEIGESRSKETGKHVKRVARYSYLLASLYGLPKDEAKKLKMASPMHDIGKIAIPDSILNKPARHTEEEFEIMKTHSKLGFEMLNKSNRPIIKAAAIIAHQHHEKYDGSGYPNSLQGEEIHIYGRISAIADVFDALGSQRVYKKAWEPDEILQFFKDEKGKHFDPKLIDLFFDNLDDFLKIRNEFKDI